MPTRKKYREIILVAFNLVITKCSGRTFEIKRTVEFMEGEKDCLLDNVVSMLDF